MELLTALIFLLGAYGLLGLFGFNNMVTKAILIVVFIIISLTSYLTYFDTLSRPKSVDVEYLRDDNEVKVRAFSMEPGVALYVLVQLKDIVEPRYYKFPWNENTEKMAKALIEGEEKEQQMLIGKPFEKSLSEERIAYPEPQQAMPLKQPKSETKVFELDTVP